MNRKTLYMLFSLLMVTVMMLGACAPATQQMTEEPVAPEQPAAEPTAEPAMTEEPAATAAPTTERRGGWLDEIDVSVVAGDSAISQLQAGAIDMYSYGLASDVYPAIKEAGLPYAQSFGGSYSIMLNPAVFNETGKSAKH